MAGNGASDSEVELLRDTVASLSSEIARLKRELGDLHGTDTVALRRAYKSLAQHVAALQEESRKVEDNIHNLQEELLKSSDIAQAVIEAGSVAAGSFAVTRAVRASPLQNLRSVSSLCGGIWVCGIAFLGMRLIQGICHKAWTSGYTNPAVKRQLVSDWQHLQERITIMSQLLDWAQSDALLQQQDVPLSEPRQLPSAPPLPAASAPPYA
ncbi:hypothetical protein ABBQ38_002569 [Trebouxia sp. C0009 RCD-2024]